MKQGLSFKTSGAGVLACGIPCVVTSLTIFAAATNAGNTVVQLFDSNIKPAPGTIAVRRKVFAPGTDGKIELEGGRGMKHGIWIAVTATATGEAVPEVDSVDTTVLGDVAFTLYPPEQKPVDLLPILEKLTMRLEALPQLPVTPQATRPANTTKPVPTR